GASADTDFAQATDAKKFVWYDALLDGYPELRSDGVDDLMQTGAFSFDRPCTVFLVYRNIVPGASAAHDVVFDGLSDYFAYVEDTRPYTQIYGESSFTVEELFSNNQYVLITIGHASDGGATGYFRRNGVDKGSWAGSVASAGGGLTLAAAFDLSRFTNIGFVVFLMYDSKLGDVDRATIENGIHTRYPSLW
ncbi:MAG: hypothetical protein KKG99_10005, partial [Bacteroidetes bacterium]|nr:hypothetical protein [Bacteroidota bacterium]